MKGFLTCLLVTIEVMGVIFYMNRTRPPLCKACRGIDPRFNHTDAQGEWVPCDRCRGFGYEPPSARRLRHG